MKLILSNYLFRLYEGYLNLGKILYWQKSCSKNAILFIISKLRLSTLAKLITLFQYGLAIA